MHYCVLDAHCDTISELVNSNEKLCNNNLHIDIKRLKWSKSCIQAFAAFIDPEKMTPSPFNYANMLIDHYFTEISNNSDHISHCNSIADVENELSSDKIAALLTIEGGDCLEGKIENLRYFYNRGVRALTLTWNYSNEISGGIEDADAGGLTVFGREVVSEMNNLGMVIDVSHLSERGFWDVMEITRYPVIASHSNAKAICPHIRNLSDEQVNGIIQNGGCIGVNFYPLHLNGTPLASLDDIVRHVAHFIELGAEDHIGFGSDFDGVGCLPDGIEGVQNFCDIVMKFEKMGYSQNLINKISSGNFLRVFSHIIKN